jgi:biopolymer transport protein ExbD
MRRFSQRNHLVTLNEINITPLLDLAFVLLIIFIITRPLLEQSMDLKVPSVGKLPAQQQIQRRDIRTIEIAADGRMRYRARPIELAQLEQELVKEFRQNPRIVVSIRPDKGGTVERSAQVLAICARNGIKQVAFQTSDK